MEVSQAFINILPVGYKYSILHSSISHFDICMLSEVCTVSPSVFKSNSLFQSNKEVRSPRAAAIDLPVVSDGVRNIKSMWEKGNVFSSTVSTPSSNKVSHTQ